MLKIPDQPAALKTLLADIAATQAELRRVAIAITTNSGKLATAKADRDSALDARTALDVDLAKETDEAKAATLEGKVKKASTLVETTTTQHDRIDRIQRALRAEETATIARLTDLIAQLEPEINGQYRRDVEQAVVASMRETAKPLVALLQQIATISQASGSSWFGTMLDEVLLPSGEYQRPIVSNGMLRDLNGAGISMTATAQTDKGLVQLQQTFAAPMRALREARQALELAKNPVSPEEREQRERESQVLAEEQAREKVVTEAEDQARQARASQPPPPSQEKAAAQFREARRIREGGQPGDSEFHFDGEMYWAPTREIAAERHSTVLAERLRVARAELVTETHLGRRQTLVNQIEETTRLMDRLAQPA